MKKLLLVTMFMVFCMSAATLHAQENAPLGKGTLAVKFGGITFTDAPMPADDLGLYGGLEGYIKVTEDLPLYLGAEIGASESSVAFNQDKMRITPFELNIKYAKATKTPPFNFVVDIGGGLSFIYAEYFDTFMFQPDLYTKDWLFGGQVFVDVIDVMGDWFLLGLNLKYQITGDLETAVGYTANYSNFRGTVQVGVVF